MNIGKAIAIFKQIDSDKYTDNEKGVAIAKVLNMATGSSESAGIVGISVNQMREL